MTQSTSLIRFFLLLLIPIHLIAFNPSKNSDLSAKEHIENKIQLAETYYMLMLDEGIGTYAQNKSEKFIKEARQLLKKSSLDDEAIKNYTIQLNTIEEELEDSISVQYNTLEGYFPLLKYTASSFFFSPEESEVHTLIKRPDYIAIKNAAKSLVSSLGGPGEVVFNSIPHDSKLEKLTFSIFNNESSLTSHTDKDVVSTLNDADLISKFNENNITKEISERLFKSYSGNPLYVVTVTKELSDKREYFYSLNADYYDQNGYSQTKSVSSSAYAIDERSNWIGLIAIHIFFLVFAFFFTYFNQKKWDYKLYSMTLLFFLFGRVLPLVMVPSIMAFKPDGDTHVIYSSWWVFVMGIVVFILPVIAIKMFYGRLTEYISLPDIAGKGELVGFAIASGVLAFLTVPYIFGFGNTLDFSKITAFSLLSIAILLSGFVMGKVLDDNDKMDEKNLILFAITSALIMTAFLHGESSYLIIVSIFTMLLAGGLLYTHNKKIRREIEEKNKLTVEDDPVIDVECHNLENVNLNQIVLDPPYQKYDYYQDVFQSIQPIYDGKATYCVLKGDGGAGKTVTAKILIDSIGRTFADRNQPVLFLSSNCDRNDGEEVPYGMFYDLLDSTFNMDLFGQREKDEKFDNVVNMASKFLMGPVASFLASKDSGEQKSFSKNDIYVFVKNKLLELSNKSTIILFVDDLQWIDTASKELLKYLMDEFNVNSDCNILFVFTVRDTDEGNEQVVDLGLSEATHSIGFINTMEQRQLLEKSFCISQQSSQWIVDWAAEKNSKKVYPYILVDAVGNLARSDVFEIVNNRFNIKEDFDFENPPIPEGPQKEVKQFLDTHPQYVEILSFAAILGKEFHVSHISYGLDITYLETVRLLDSISEESGFIFDLMDKDDVYQFRSQILLDALRSNIRYSTEGILSIHVPQSIRHFHALAANALRKTQEDDFSSKLIIEIANHYYAAGKLYAKEAIDYLEQAVDACRNLFEYDDALSYLNKVDEVLELTKGETVKSKELRLLIECDKSNVQGIGSDATAEKTLVYLNKYPDADDELKFAATRACYDAALQNNYDQAWFAKSAQTAKEYLLTSDSVLMQAEGYHFIAVCMKAKTDDEKTEQLDHFNKAIELTKTNYPSAYAKIANSLAESLSYGDDNSKKKAKELFLDSLEIKENTEIKDLPGMARTYGGLGRLAFFTTPPNTVEAKEYFKKDLDIAEEISDQRGISQMNSLLGSCAKMEEEYEKAIHYYDKSIALENNPFDVHASYEGKLYALDQLSDKKRLFEVVKTYMAVMDKIGSPSRDIPDKIINTLDKYNDNEACKQVLKSLKNNG